MPRNLDRKREYDRVRYAKLQKEHSPEFQESVRARKAKQRERSKKSVPVDGDYGSSSKPFSLDEPLGRYEADQKSFHDWQRSENR